ncbi:putative MFS transporter [Seiridium unicorne]|uniref:MFS transporter n=1 Tax=Seiridium unicorne TaxID=138068 RepID=A0ABR2V0V5_9PEZI
MVCLGLVLSMFFVPEIQSTLGVQQETRSKSLKGIALIFDPRGVFAQLLVPRILLAHLTCGLLATTQYGLLAAIRHIINPRFNLTTPLVSGLFYIAPGVGFFTGSIVGGRLSDRTVRHYIVKRDGVRIPEDRLHSGLVGLFGVLPAAALIFGWTLEKEVGGLAVPIISAFWIGIGLMGTFNSLNTYAAEASPGRRSEVLSAKYVIQWAFGAASTAAVIPFIDATGPGLVFTVCEFKAGFNADNEVALHMIEPRSNGPPAQAESEECQHNEPHHSRVHLHSALTLIENQQDQDWLTSHPTISQDGVSLLQHDSREDGQGPKYASDPTRDAEANYQLTAAAPSSCTSTAHINHVNERTTQYHVSPLRWWYVDILAAATATVNLVAIVCVLLAYDGKSQVAWPSEVLTINGLVAILATGGRLLELISV